MKKFFFAVMMLLTVEICSQDKGFGMGIIIGEPTGLSLKGWISPASAIDAGLAWSFVNEGSLHIHVDYLYHMFNVIDVSSGKMPLFVGVGGRIKIKDKKHNPDNRFGIRIPFGFAYMFSGAPVDIFLEIAPVLDLTPATDLSVNGGIGFRYFFK